MLFFKIRFLLLLSFILYSYSCNQLSNDSEKKQTNRNNYIDVHNEIKEIQFDSVNLSSFSKLYTISDYIIISDYKSIDNLLYIFKKDNFDLVAKTAIHGQGPDEISNMGHIGIDEKKRLFYVTDHGKRKIFCYSLDSVLINDVYKPSTKINIGNHQFPSEYVFVNDSLCFGIMTQASDSGFDEIVGLWNIFSGEISQMEYVHPQIKRKRISFAFSQQDSIYVECYKHHDLLSICDLNGKLKYNIYGSKWNNKTSNKILYYDDVVICNNKIIVSYSGRNNFSDEYMPSDFVVFNTKGDYIKTLKTGRKIVDFCYDKQYNRIIIHFDDEMQFGYIDLNQLL